MLASPFLFIIYHDFSILLIVHQEMNCNKNVFFIEGNNNKTLNIIIPVNFQKIS